MAGTIPDRSKWKAEKKKYGAPDGLGKANMGKLFDAYDQGVKKGRLDSLKPLDALAKALPAYIADAKKKKDKQVDKFVKDVVEPIHKQIGDLISTYQKMANPTAAFAQKVKKCLVNLKDLPPAPTREQYQGFWSEHIRDVGTALGQLKKLDKNAEKLHKLWLPLTKDPSAIPENKLPGARKLVAVSLKTLTEEGKKLHLIA